MKLAKHAAAAFCLLGGALALPASPPAQAPPPPPAAQAQAPEETPEAQAQRRREESRRRMEALQAARTAELSKGFQARLMVAGTPLLPASQAEAAVPVRLLNGYSPPKTHFQILGLLGAASPALTVEPLLPGGAPSGDPAPLLATFALEGPLPPGERPALLVVAGLDGSHLVGVEAAMRLIARLARDAADPGRAEIFRRRTIYVVPCLACGAIQKTFDEKPLLARPANETPDDDDGDGLFGEDPPDDLDGDGAIAWMRAERHDGPWRLDSEDSRLLAEARPEKGERGGWLLLPEGRDDDRDGEFNEDAPGGTNFGRNWPYGFPWFESGAGVRQISEPETRALADFVVARDNIGLVLAFGPGDNLSKAPKGEERPLSLPGPVQPIKAPDAEDAAYVAEIAREWRGAAGLNKELEANGVPGDFADWMYFHRGRLALKTPLWTPAMQVALAEGEETPAKASGLVLEMVPDLAFSNAPLEMVLRRVEFSIKKPVRLLDQDRANELVTFSASGWTKDSLLTDLLEPLSLKWRLNGSEGAYEVASEFPEEAPATPGAPEESAGEAEGKDGAPDSLKADRAFLAWLDENAPERFLPWTAVESPDFPGRRVEVGGLHPLAKANPPGAMLDSLLDPQIEWAAGLAAKLPEVAIVEKAAKRLSPGVWEVSFVVRNEGGLPTVPRHGERSKEVMPCWAEIDLPAKSFLGGKRRTRLPRLAPGESAEVRAVVAAGDASELTLRVRSAFAGRAEATLKLED